MPELVPAAPGTPDWHAARRGGVTATDIVTILGPSARELFTDHWAGCEACQEGLPCAVGDPLWYAMHEEVIDDA